MPGNEEELSEEFIDKWVDPFYMNCLSNSDEQTIKAFAVAAKEIDINDKTIDNYVKFINENKKYWQQTGSRNISYWNEYYRQQFPKLKHYIGKQIVDRLKANAQQAAW